MAVILGRTYPDLFSAVGCHSGLAHGSATSNAGAILAMRDGPDPAALAQTGPHATVHRRNSNDVVRQSLAGQARGSPADITIVEETGTAGGRSFTRRIHQEKMGEVLAEQWTVHGTGHAWSGGNPYGSYTDTCGPSASEEMLRFFIRYPAAA